MHKIQALKKYGVVNSYILKHNFELIETNETINTYKLVKTQNDTTVVIKLEVYTDWEDYSFQNGSMVIEVFPQTEDSKIVVNLLNPYSQVKIPTSDKEFMAIRKLEEVLEFINRYILEEGSNGN